MSETNETKRVKIFLPNNIVYHGIILSEDDLFITICDKFKKEVRLNKNHIVSIQEVQE